MDALRASLAAVEGGRSGDGQGRDLGRLSKDELYDLVKAADIRGRGDMSKQELVSALRSR